MRKDIEYIKAKSLESYSNLISKGLKIGDLAAVYDSRKSFYGKAKLYEMGGIMYLVSYSTIVAKIYKNVAQIFGYYSQTTARHINDFLYQNGFDTLNKKEMMKEQENIYGLIIEKQ